MVALTTALAASPPGVAPAISRTLPGIQEKWLVDCVNSLSVAKDHLRVQDSRNGLVGRVKDGFTGEGKRRQGEINASLIEGLEGSLRYIGQVAEKTALNSFAIAKVNDRLSEFKTDMGYFLGLANDRFEEVETAIDSIQVKLVEQSSAIQALDRRVRGREHLDFILDRWRAGGYEPYSPVARCYVAVEELRWGAFYNFLMAASAADRQAWLSNLSDCLAGQLSEDINRRTSERVVTKDYWLLEQSIDAGADEMRKALAFFGDWTDSSSSPLAYTASQRPNILPLGVPKLCTSDRLARGLSTEVLGWHAHA